MYDIYIYIFGINMFEPPNFFWVQNTAAFGTVVTGYSTSLSSGGCGFPTWNDFWMNFSRKHGMNKMITRIG